MSNTSTRLTVRNSVISNNQSTTDRGGIFFVGSPTDGHLRIFLADIGAVEFQGNNDTARIWSVDFAGDGASFGIEVALGTDIFTADSNHGRNLGAPTFDASGHPVLHFGQGSPPLGTVWILRRSPDLSPGSFTEIFRQRNSGTIPPPPRFAAPGIIVKHKGGESSFTDTNPLAGVGFYRFEAMLEP